MTTSRSRPIEAVTTGRRQASGAPGEATSFARSDAVPPAE
jgi:hypothetical protein